MDRGRLHADRGNRAGSAGEHARHDDAGDRSDGHPHDIRGGDDDDHDDRGGDDHDIHRSTASSPTGRDGRGARSLHLGTNGPIDGAWCDALMDVLAGRRVVLVTLHVPRAWEAGNNAVLRDCAIHHGAGIADWSSVAGGADFLAGDGYHLNSEGAQAYAGLLAGVI